MDYLLGVMSCNEAKDGETRKIFEHEEEKGKGTRKIADVLGKTYYFSGKVWSNGLATDAIKEEISKIVEHEERNAKEALWFEKPI
ncbi:hypothetical protein V6N13_147324 [Hibiscus sabdariffa]